MKRYRFLRLFINSMHNLARAENLPDNIRHQLDAQIIEKYGARGAEGKLHRFAKTVPPPFRPVLEFNELFEDVADTYIFGRFYSALTSACCLGERILNVLVLGLRGFYKSSSRYKEIYRQDSFQNWDLVIDVLREWGIIGPELLVPYYRLAEIRRRSVHYNRIENMEELATEATDIVMRITNTLFGTRDDVFFWVPGEIYVRSSMESNPFVQTFILPSCFYVGYKHAITSGEGGSYLKDPHQYTDEKIRDEEFITRRNEWRNGQTDQAG